MSHKDSNYLLKDLQPSQFYISQAKLSNIQAWFRKDDLSNFEPLPVKVLDGIPILTDGHKGSCGNTCRLGIGTISL